MGEAAFFLEHGVFCAVAIRGKIKATLINTKRTFSSCKPVNFYRCILYNTCKRRAFVRLKELMA
jgi:hypothetical protein